MANSNFIVHNGLTVGSTTIFAGNGDIITSGNLTSTGTVTTIYNENVTGNIVPTGNVTYNLGAANAWWNRFYGVSTQALYADLAENYRADRVYPAGQVLMFGGAAEVTVADADTTKVAGIVSTNPAHLMNGGLQGTNVTPLALMGRVPCMIIGPVAKGDLMVSAGWGFAKANNDAAVGQVVGKALEDFPSAAKGVIEVVVGRV